MITLNKLYHISVSSGIHAIIFIIFLVILYFTVIIKLVKSIITDFIVDGAKSYQLDYIDLSNVPNFKYIMDILKKEGDKETKKYEEYNNKLKWKTIKMLGIVVISFISFIIIMPYIFGINMHEFETEKLIKETIILTLVVGAYEFLFMKYIVLEYSFYNFNQFLYDYVQHNTNAIKEYLPSIILHFLVDIPEYTEMIPKYIKNTLRNKVNNVVNSL
jgi:hypothetical protein